MIRPNYIIGIDPDCDKSGFALINVEKKHVSEVEAMKFPRLLEAIRNVKCCEADGSKVVVVVEAGYLISSNWHLHPKDSKAKAAAKGNAVGRNHETGRKIVEMLRHYGFKVIEQIPLRKCWQGKDGKISHEEIKQFIPGLPARTNQEVRDAALLAWNYANLPIRVKPIKQRSYAKSSS